MYLLCSAITEYDTERNISMEEKETDMRGGNGEGGGKKRWTNKGGNLKLSSVSEESKWARSHLQSYHLHINGAKRAQIHNICITRSL